MTAEINRLPHSPAGGIPESDRLQQRMACLCETRTYISIYHPLPTPPKKILLGSFCQGNYNHCLFSLFFPPWCCVPRTWRWTRKKKRIWSIVKISDYYKDGRSQIQFVKALCLIHALWHHLTFSPFPSIHKNLYKCEFPLQICILKHTHIHFHNSTNTP